jgi:hypothetical protein
MVAAICLVGLLVRLLVLKPSSTFSSSLSARQDELLIGQHHHGDDSERMFCSFVRLCLFERSRHGRLVAFKESA